MCYHLSSLFSLLSSIPPEDAERARPWRLHMRDGFSRRNHDPPFKCSDSSRRSTTLWRAAWCRKGLVPLRRPHLGTSGGLLGCVFFLLSSLFSLLSPLFSLLLVVVVLRLLDPMSRITHSTHDIFCLVSALFSLSSSLCSLPSRLRTRRRQGHGDCICALHSFDAITIHP